MGFEFQFDQILDGLPDVSDEILFKLIEYSNSIGSTGSELQLTSLIKSNFNKNIDQITPGIKYDLLVLNNPRPEIKKHFDAEIWIQKYLDSFISYSNDSTYIILQSPLFSIWFLKSFYLQKRMIYKLTHLNNFNFIGYNQTFVSLQEYESLFLLEKKN